MRKKDCILFLCFLASYLNAFALDVTTSTSGELNTLVPDKGITELTVNGEIDARDIRFIAEELTELKSLDLSSANIVAYSGSSPCFGDILEYEACSLPDYCFFDKEYSNIVLPVTLQHIGNGAFASCDSLKSVVFPQELVSIGDYAFCASGLTSVSLPASIKNIGNGAFARCSLLQSADMGNLTADCTLGNNIFADCTALTDVTLGNSLCVMPAGLLAGCKALNQVNLGTSSAIESIGENAFAATGLTGFNFSACPKLKVIGRWAFACVNLTEISLPEGVESIGEGAFFYNHALGSASLPSSTSFIDSHAFVDNESMAQMNVSAESVPELGNNVFSGIDQPSVLLKVPDESILAYKNAEQWKEFKIAGENSSIDNIDDNTHKLKAYFTGHILVIESSCNIMQVNVFEPSGVRLVATTPQATSVHIDMSGLNGHIYLVNVSVENGKNETIKLIRQ